MLVDTRYTKDYGVLMLMDTVYTMHYVVFSGVDTMYTIHSAVFSGVNTKMYWSILRKKYQQFIVSIPEFTLYVRIFVPVLHVRQYGMTRVSAADEGGCSP